MSTRDWSDQENDLVVADYFAMLAKELTGEAYSKAEHRRQLVPHLQARSEGAVEFKHQNISAVLQAAGQTWAFGYKPAVNFQDSLEAAVARWLDGNDIPYNYRPQGSLQRGMADRPGIFIGPSPTLSNRPPPKELDRLQRVARKFDAAGRDERNRDLGRAGEKLVLAHEKAVLAGVGRLDLADKVKWVSEVEGDGAGYDIASFTTEGARRLIEVKTTNGWERTPFHISRNELAVAEQKRSEWCLFRLWNFAREPRAFELYPPLDAHVSLTATSFQASFH